MAGHFIIPKKYYQFTFVALIILTIFTVLISRVDLGFLNTPVALAVATVTMAVAIVAMIFLLSFRFCFDLTVILFFGAFYLY